MSPKDQVEVLNTVLQLAAMVRDIRAQDAALREDFAKVSANDGARLADFERRILLVETNRELDVAAAAGTTSTAAKNAGTTTEAGTPGTVPAAGTHLKPEPVAVTRPDVALPAGAPPAAKRYRVQAASPGLALLTEVARGGGDGAQVQVTVGDTLPGWGKVLAVSQHGTAWVVATEHGVID
jgi:hypothetical protein